MRPFFLILGLLVNTAVMAVSPQMSFDLNLQIEEDSIPLTLMCREGEESQVQIDLSEQSSLIIAIRPETVQDEIMDLHLKIIERRSGAADHLVEPSVLIGPDEPVSTRFDTQLAGEIELTLLMEHLPLLGER